MGGRRGQGQGSRAQARTRAHAHAHPLVWLREAAALERMFCQAVRQLRRKKGGATRGASADSAACASASLCPFRRGAAGARVAPRPTCRGQELVQ
jgi:hypothetical protein